MNRGKMEKILVAYGLPRENVAAIMMLYKNKKVNVRSPGGDTDFFDIVAGVLQGDILASYLFIICLDYVLRTSIDLMKENGLLLEKARSRRSPAQTITDVDYAEDIELLANTTAQTESLLYRLELVAGGVGLHENPGNTEYSCLNQRGVISTLNGDSQKLVDNFIYLGSSISSDENYVNMWLAKAWTAIDRFIGHMEVRSFR